MKSSMVRGMNAPCSFYVIVLTHWAEHFARLTDFRHGWPRPKAMAFWPMVSVAHQVRGPALFLRPGYAGWLVAIAQGIYGRSYTWWMIAFWIQFWHHMSTCC